MENTQLGPFQVFEKLGSHRRHHVYRAVQVEQQREVALKFITLPPDYPREAALAKIRAEAEIIKALDHPNLVKMFGAGCEGEHVFFAHEVVKGESLAPMLARRGRLACDLVIDFSRQIASVLEYLHQREIIHTKLTTDKLLIEDEARIRLADLRLNRSRKRRWDATKRASLEIAAYMPPEQLVGEGATAKSDLYALGAIMYEMLTGKLPYPPQTMAQLVRDKQNPAVPSVAQHLPSCPAWLDKLVQKLLHPDPSQRPHSARAVILTLDQISKVEQSKLAAASELSRGFSALALDSDRSEARRALGADRKRKSIEEAEPGLQIPILQFLPFVIGGLLLMGGIIYAAFNWPFGATGKELLDRADTLLASDEPEQWQSARALYERVLSGNDDPELLERADRGYVESRRKMMMNRLRRGAGLLEREEVREFYSIMEIEESGRPRDALHQYRRLAARLDENDEMRHVRAEVESRIKSLEAMEMQAKELYAKLKSLEEAARAPDTTDETRTALAECQQELQRHPELQDFLRDAPSSSSPPDEQPGDSPSGDAGQ